MVVTGWNTGEWEAKECHINKTKLLLLFWLHQGNYCITNKQTSNMLRQQKRVVQCVLLFLGTSRQGNALKKLIIYFI